MLKLFLALIVSILPWPIKRFILVHFYKYVIHKTARIGFSLIMVKKMTLSAGARIGHFTVIKGLDEFHLGESSRLGNLNWVSGFPTNTSSKHFSDQLDRDSALFIGSHSAITSRHLIDCTASIRIGKYTTFAGFRSQILTHSINIEENRQRAQPVNIGDYCFIGTGCILLGGSELPDNSVMGAGAVLNKHYQETYTLYAGVPAKPIKRLKSDMKYFQRKIGFVI